MRSSASTSPARPWPSRWQAATVARALETENRPGDGIAAGYFRPSWCRVNRVPEASTDRSVAR
ncbi:hypothetical protein SCYAM73S_02998 [Streptomyces cyaneofuscatus]